MPKPVHQSIPTGNITPLFCAEDIQARIAELGQMLAQAYTPYETLHIVGILSGAAIFLSDLVRQLPHPCQIHWVTLGSYGAGMVSSGTVQDARTDWDKLGESLHGQHVLVIEDILDTGRTWVHFKTELLQRCTPSSLKLVTLFDKPGNRDAALQSVMPDFCGFPIDNHFIVGYGLDLDGYFRNLPYVGVFHPNEAC